MTDFIEQYERLFVDSGVPAIYTRWCAISTVSAILGRHVWNVNAQGVVYPNLFVMLIGSPAAGKSLSISRVREILEHLNLHTAAEHTTRASLTDALDDARIEYPKSYHHLILITGELVQTIQHAKQDPQLLGTLADWWDCPEIVKERKRTHSIKKQIPKVCFGMLVGIQPSIFATTFPPEAWSGGFLSRMIFVHTDERRNFKLRGKGARNLPVTKDIFPFAEKVRKLVGKMIESPGVTRAYDRWRAQGWNPKPSNPRLEHYVERREHQVEKLSMISAASRLSMRIEEEDYERAKGWTIEVEQTMEDMFHKMESVDTVQILQDIHQFIVRVGEKEGEHYDATKQQVMRYIMQRVAPRDVATLIEQGIAAGYFTQVSMKGTDFFRARVLEAERERALLNQIIREE